MFVIYACTFNYMLLFVLASCDFVLCCVCVGILALDRVLLVWFSTSDTNLSHHTSEEQVDQEFASKGVVQIAS